MSDDNPDDGLYAIRYGDNEDFVDLVFRIQNHRIAGDYGKFELVGLHGGEEVGFGVEYRLGMRPGVRDGEVDTSAFCRRGIIFRSVGPRSDRLVWAMRELYGIDAGGEEMNPEIAYTSIALDGDPRNIHEERVRFKLFGNDRGDEDEYFESFFHIDLKQGFAFWNEKDPEYRLSLLKGISR